MDRLDGRYSGVDGSEKSLNTLADQLVLSEGIQMLRADELVMNEMDDSNENLGRV
jgi:hypothetical protein